MIAVPSGKVSHDTYQGIFKHFPPIFYLELRPLLVPSDVGNNSSSDKKNLFYFYQD